jgi:hypothetical protein
MGHHWIFNGATQALENKQAQLANMLAMGLLEVRGLGAHRAGRGGHRDRFIVRHEFPPLREQNVSSVFEWNGRAAQRVDQ